MPIERTEPMKIHKRLVISLLRAHPDRGELIPGWPGTVEEFIAALEAAPGEWFVGGVLQDPDPPGGVVVTADREDGGPVVVERIGR